MNSRTNSELQNSRHRNQVKLLGCCIEGEEKMLVYEYMTNRSLDLILFHPVNNIVLDWAKRSNIINGIARAYSRGLMYLHQDSRLRVIHRDLKASNILLDSDMNPKISDFGLARTFGGDDTGANTSRVIGTYGYMSPEYAMEGLFSVKSDVFSFGVLEVKIVSGKGNKWFYHGDRRVNLVGHAWMLYKEERSLELVDVCVRNTCDDWSEVIELIHIMHSLLHILQHHIYSVQHSKRIIRMFLVVVDSGDYAALLEYLKGGQEDQQFRRRLA